MLKKKIKGFLISASICKDPLFRGDDQLFRKEAAKCKAMLEWGVGNSSIYFLNNETKRLYSIESSVDWIDKTKTKISETSIANWTPLLIDLGETKKWGYPVNLDKISNFPSYSNVPPDWFECVDLFLIDGRFRVACFLEVLLGISEQVTVLFDDYVPRPQYHVVERFASVRETCGAMAAFDIVPPDYKTRVQIQNLKSAVECLAE